MDSRVPGRVSWYNNIFQRGELMSMVCFEENIMRKKLVNHYL